MRGKYGVNKYMENLNREGNYVKRTKDLQIQLGHVTNAHNKKKDFTQVNSQWTIGLHGKQDYKTFRIKQAET